MMDYTPGKYTRSPIIRNYLWKLTERTKKLSTDDWYAVETSILPLELAQIFLQCTLDSDSAHFMDNCYEKSDKIFLQMYHNLVRFLMGFFLSMTTVNGILHRGSMFVASHEQFLALLNLPVDFLQDSWIDLGAGDGRVTKSLLPHFERAFATEQSPSMRWRLQEKGFTLLDIDKWQNQQYDLITALNLMDRIDKPYELLKDLKRALKPDGTLILAVVIPFDPIYENGTSFGSPDEIIEVEGDTIESQILTFVYDILLPTGFDLVRFTRLPYLCEGDLHNDFFRLDDIVFVLKLPLQESDHAATEGNALQSEHVRTIDETSEDKEELINNKDAGSAKEETCEKTKQA